MRPGRRRSIRPNAPLLPPIAEKAGEAETDPAKQSLESLIAPIVRDAVQAELKSAKAAEPAGDPMDQTSSADPFA